VIQRALDSGCKRFIVCGGSLEDSTKALEICEKLDPKCEKLYLTIGVHPTRCNEFLPESEVSATPEEHVAKLRKLIEANPERVVGIGEFGLDYDRTQFCEIETQQKFFKLQLEELVKPLKLPMYLHLRGEKCGLDFFRIMTEVLGDMEAASQVVEDSSSSSEKYEGVVHSFTGTQAELEEILKFGLYVGINGCSLKTEENCTVAAEIPLDRLMLETDCPYCEIKNTHFSSKFVKTKFAASKKYEAGKLHKGRNEP